MEKLKKPINIINIIFFALIIAFDVLYITIGGLLIKTITSSLFVILGAINLFYALNNGTKKPKFAILLFAGLVFAMLGDVLLEIEFVVGAALFALGHVLFFISYCFLEKVKWTDFIYGAGLFIPVLMVILFVPIFDFGGALMQVVGCVYALIISLMVGKSWANMNRDFNALYVIIFLGSILFFISDFMLLFSQFGNDLPRIFGVLCLATYYPAEFVLAYSIKASKEVKEKD